MNSSIPDEDWTTLREAVSLYAVAVIGALRDPQFVPERAFTFGREFYDLQTQLLDEPRPTILPNTGRAVRGMPGTKIKFERRKEAATVWDAVRAASGGELGQDTPFAERVREADGLVRYAIGRSKPLRQAIQLVSWGPGVLETFAKLEAQATQLLPRFSLEAAQVERLLVGAIERRGYPPSRLAELTFDDAESLAIEAVESLRRSVKGEFFPFAVIALLNSPPVDHNQWIAADGEWYERPFKVTLGHPDDALCSRVMNKATHDELGIYAPEHLGVLNCYIRLDYELPATLTDDELSGAHFAAGEYVRKAVDILRILSAEDIGIVYLTGFSPFDDKTGRDVLSPPFSTYFPERPNQMYRTPMRRLFDPPSGEALSDSLLRDFNGLFDSYGLKNISISGLPAAMERFRGTYDRYAPDESGRLVDAVTGLEALYLPDAQGELVFRLQARAAWFLAPEAQEMAARVEIATQVHEIYGARSALVHTGKLSAKLRPRTAKLTEQAVILLRLSLWQFLRTEFGKDVSSEKLSGRWLEITLGQSTLKSVDVPPLAAASVTSDTSARPREPPMVSSETPSASPERNE